MKNISKENGRHLAGGILIGGTVLGAVCSYAVASMLFMIFGISYEDAIFALQCIASITGIITFLLIAFWVVKKY